MITIFEVEQGIETATLQTDRFMGTQKRFLTNVILPLQDILQQGIRANLKCDPESIRHKMNSLENAINRKFNL